MALALLVAGIYGRVTHKDFGAFSPSETEACIYEMGSNKVQDSDLPDLDCSVAADVILRLLAFSVDTSRRWHHKKLLLPIILEAIR